MKRILSIALCVVLMVSCLASCSLFGNKSDLEAIKDAKKIVVGVTVYPPMDYVNSDTGLWEGFDAELAQMFAESLDVNCQIVIIDWNNKVAELKSRQIDLIWNGMTASDELAEQIDLSVPYAKNAQVAIVKSNSSITKDNIQNAIVAVENGSAGEEVAREVIGVSDSKLVEKSDGQVSALQEVLSGNAEVAIVDLTLATSVLGEGIYADLKLVDDAVYGEEIFAVGLRKDSDLKESLDAFLREKYADGTLAELAEKYTVVLNEETLAE